MAIQAEIITDAGSEISDSASSLWESFLDALPRIGVALTIVVFGYFISIGIRRFLYRSFGQNNTESFAKVMSKLTSWVVLAAFVLIALTVTFPSVKPVDLLAGLGFFSVAVGFAFQDILENTLSGMLLLFRQPFQSGDQIAVDGNEGTVEAITIRETRIRQYDGQLIVIPNRDVYKNAIRVQTDRTSRRIAFTVGVAYEADLDEVRAVVHDALSQVDELEQDPAPEALFNEMGASTMDVEVRAWAASPQHDSRIALDAAIRGVKRSLDEARIEMPSDIIALQATQSFRAAMHDRPVTPGGAVEPSGREPGDEPSSRREEPDTKSDTQEANTK